MVPFAGILLLGVAGGAGLRHGGMSQARMLFYRLHLGGFLLFLHLHLHFLAQWGATVCLWFLPLGLCRKHVPGPSSVQLFTPLMVWDAPEDWPVALRFLL